MREDVEMLDEGSLACDEGRFFPYENLSDYEAKIRKDEDPVTPPSPKKQPTVRQVGSKAAKPPVAKYRNPAKPVKVEDEYVDTKAFVVHGIPCHQPMAVTLQNVKNKGVRGIMGARWLRGDHRRMSKTTTSVVIFVSSAVSFHVQGSQK
ncbi:hypothetical protein BGX38DRAFT_1274288 [Terfezia claveryi]|nr:hypothetical protein BGX38DRAFT_1274288 [Terfezia claveryi]